MPDHNPYASPNDPGSPFGTPMQQQTKPAAIKVFGVLNIVFGLLGICGMVLSGAILFGMPQNAKMPNPTLDLMQNNLAYRGFIIASLGLGFVFVIILILSGIGLLQYRKQGRKLAIWYGWYAILSGIVGTVVNVVFVFVPMMREANGGGPGAAGLIGGMVGGLVGLIFPILLLVFMNKQNVIDALE